ncbi:MAG: thiamine phosphate synthase [Pseudomonadota bacterium]
MNPTSQSTTKGTGIPNGSAIPCQLYLSVCASSGMANVERVAAILQKVAIPSLLLEPKNGETLTATHVLPFIDTAHENGVAVMIADDPCLARTVKADGIHLNWSLDGLDRLSEAREIAGGRLMIGADAGFSRHNAMVIAEAGAEYVAFGLPAGTVDLAKGASDRSEMVEWWSEVFEIPCVATDIEGADEQAASDLAAAGADFVCVRTPEGKSTADLIEWAERLVHRLDQKQAAAA